MKRNITLAIDKPLLKRARAIAVQRGKSGSALLSEELNKLVNREEEYARAKLKAFAYLESPFHLGGKGISDGRACMPGKAFVDSNILIYAHDGDAGTKQRQAAELVKGLWQSGLGRLSTHVLQEFYVNATERSKGRWPVGRRESWFVDMASG